MRLEHVPGEEMNPVSAKPGRDSPRLGCIVIAAKKGGKRNSRSFYGSPASRDTARPVCGET